METGHMLIASNIPKYIDFIFKYKLYWHLTSLSNSGVVISSAEANKVYFRDKSSFKKFYFYIFFISQNVCISLIRRNIESLISTYVNIGYYR